MPLSLALARLNKPRRLLLELKRVTSPLRLRHLRYPFALEQLAKGYVLRGQGHQREILKQIGGGNTMTAKQYLALGDGRIRSSGRIG